MRWDLFCHVVDNFGDIGVCWRLAADLAARGEVVRLWVDDPAPLAWMAPGGTRGVEVLHWSSPAPGREPHEIVVEAFGCNPPPGFVERMAAAPAPPVWINLEYLSAQAYVEASHGLPSPLLAGPGRGLTKWFFFPGFTDSSGGLIREFGLLEARAAFERESWLAEHVVRPAADELVVSVFCYDNPALAGLIEVLSQQPTLLLTTPDAAERQVAALVGPARRRGGLRAHAMPWLTQAQFDRLLWSCDINAVRGEDSLVRAIWAGAPLLWQIYPQRDDAHAAKLEAFLDRQLEGAAAPLAAQLRALTRGWNGLGPLPVTLPDRLAWRGQIARWRDRLANRLDLTSSLLRFAAAKR